MILNFINVGQKEAAFLSVLFISTLIYLVYRVVKYIRAKN